MKGKAGADQPRRMLSAAGRIEPKCISFVRNIKDRPLNYSVTREWGNMNEKPGAD